MTRVAYLKRNVAGAMEDVAEDWSQSSPHLSSVEPGHQMLGAEKRKNQTLLERKKREILIKNVITYFQKIIRVHVCGDKHLPTTVTTQRDVGGWMVKRQRKSSQVSPESSQSAMSRRADRV